jgi:hypothetical protein
MIDISERFSFDLGGMIGCLPRAERNRGANSVADLGQARWHLDRAIKRIKQTHEAVVLSSHSSAKQLVAFRQGGYK